MGRSADDPIALTDLPGNGGVVHATTVAVGQRALLIVGASGTGKSSLALRMIALGAKLVADDRAVLRATADGPPVASVPPSIEGMIEARGVGLLRVNVAPPTRVGAVLDLDQTETDRLPPRRTVSICGCDIPLLHNADSPHFPAALMAYLRGGMVEE